MAVTVLGGPAPAAPVSQEQRRVARLFRRAAFGATVAEISGWAAKGYTAAVDHLLGFAPASTRPADEAEVQAVMAAAQAADQAGLGFPDITAFQRWWLDRMATGSNPLEEKLALYWHGHFATGYQKVARVGPMIGQNRLLRDLAAGSFRDLCKAVTADPAMLVYLDGAHNRVSATNENYGREFMELFTLGRSNGYTQADVVAAARCFTGYTLDPVTGAATFDPTLHDQADKTLLGNTGNWQPPDVTDLVLDHHPVPGAAATFVARRMAGFLHHPMPEDAVVSAMADALVSGGYVVQPMVRTLLLRPEFMDGASLGITSPVELVASVIRALKLSRRTSTVYLWAAYATTVQDELARAATDMGQALFMPPSVAGWAGGAAWVNTATFLHRYDFAARAAQLAGDDLVAASLATAGVTPALTASYWMNLLGLLELSPETTAGIQEYTDSAAAAGDDPASVSRGVLTLLIASPDYNLR